MAISELMAVEGDTASGGDWMRQTLELFEVSRARDRSALCDGVPASVGKVVLPCLSPFISGRLEVEVQDEGGEKARRRRTGPRDRLPDDHATSCRR